MSHDRSDATAAEKFGTEMKKALLVAATHTMSAPGGWKTVDFCLSQILMDVVEVLEDFYDPNHFTQFATGAIGGHRMFKCTADQLEKENVDQKWINSNDHKVGRVFG